MDVEKYISELRDTVKTAELNYEIWWVYKSEDTRPEFIDELNRYGLFFQTSIHAHFVALLVSLYRLYETRRDTFNIPTLIKHLKEESLLDAEVMDDLEALYQTEAKSLWVKVNILRNNTFGHRSSSQTISEVFEEAAVTPDQLKELMGVTKKLLNRLSRAWNGNVAAFNLGSREDTVRLLSDLRKYAQG